MNFWKQLKQYPVVILFFVFLFGFAILDALWPKRAESELENRKLQQFPAVTLSGIISNEWMQKYENYTKDQFALRDSWIDLKSRAESMLLKTENNDIWYGKDGYLFPALMTVDDKQYQKNLEALKAMCERHPGMVDVMIVPTSSLIMRDRLPFDAPLVDEDTYLDGIRDTLSATANVIDLRETLAPHAEEYIYYRTDHHWTAQGAYYAYEAYAASRGLTTLFDTTAVPSVSVDGFYGTSYSKARNWDVVPDVLTYYDLPNTLSITGTDGTVQETGIMDEAKLETRDKYAAFLHGNNAFSVLKGDGEGSVLVIKDSYANSFVPYLTANYETIAVVDFRENVSKVEQILSEGQYDSILFLYSFDAFCSDTFFGSRIVSAS